MTALHSHILTWNKRRKLNNNSYHPRPPVPESHNRRWNASDVGNPTTNAEDDVYDRTETARVNAELVRLDLDQEFKWPRETLLWAFLLRAVQTLLYIHACTTLYCLKTERRAVSSSLGQSSQSNNIVRRQSDSLFKGAMLQTTSSWCRTT